jgi:hypothetical protein
MQLPAISNISELIITINVMGDINYKINKFNPKMVYRDSLENSILFIPNIPIELHSLIKSNVVAPKDNYKLSDFISVFSNPILLNNIVHYIKKNKGIKLVSLEESEKKRYIKNNINLILSTYFDTDNKIVINNRDYLIHSYNWNDKYKIIKTNKTFPNYEININLYVLDNKLSNNSYRYNRNRLTCDIKRKRIALDLKEMGFNVDVPDVGKSYMPYYVPSIKRPYQYTSKIKYPYTIKRGGKYKRQNRAKNKIKAKITLKYKKKYNN